MMTVGSLFSGIGGFDLGLERAGMTIKWQVEIDDFCNRVLARHYPDVPRFRDVRECGKANLAPVDLICGGFPCQPFSVAGQQRGTDDDRYLWPEMHRIIAELRPRWVLAENVPGIIRLALDTVCADLESEGYAVGAVTVPACAVDAPHIRQRVWIVANSQRGGCGPERERGCMAGIRTGRSDDAMPTTESSPDVAHTTERGQPMCGGTSRYTGLSALCGEGLADSLQPWRNERWWTDGFGSSDVPNATAIERNGRAYHEGQEQTERDGVAIVCHAISTGLEERSGLPGDDGPECASAERASLWTIEPELGRVADGVPHRVDRLRALGNAVVPQVVEALGRMILAADQERLL
jgi:DNA (cytosine-5)-methyltransferase 1